MYFTKKAIQDIGSTVRQTLGEDVDDHGTQETTGSRNGCQLCTCALVHNDSIMRRMTNGYISIISHDTEENTFNHSKGEGEVHLSSAARERDGLLFSYHGRQHMWDIGGCIADIYKG